MSSVSEASARSLLESGKLGEALSAYTRLIGEHPDNLAINLGMVSALIASQRFDEARMVLEMALERWPDQADLAFLAADTLHRQGQLTQAEKLYRFNIEQHPAHLATRRNFAVLLYQTCRFEAAAVVHAETVRLYPHEIPAWRDLGQSLVASGRDEAGFQILQEACARFPADRETRFAFALAALRQEKWAIGWENYEARWQPGELDQRLPAGTFLWTGQPIPPGKTLHILNEQGFGDNLLFARYLPFLGTLATTVSYTCHPALLPLMAHSFPALRVNTCPTVNEGDLCLPIGSLPWRLLVQCPVPPTRTPYLCPTQDGYEDILTLLQKLPANCLALTWRGSQKIALAERSIALPHLLQKLPAAHRGMTLISLQKDPSPSEIAFMESRGILDFSPLLRDFNATALILQQIGRLFSIDTAIVNLAGALGIPVTLDRAPGGDWRWPTHRTSSPWYPSICYTPLSSPADSP